MTYNLKLEREEWVVSLLSSVLRTMQVLAERLAEGLDVRLSHLVTCITWEDVGARVDCQGGQTFQADAVIVSVSAGVLKVMPVFTPVHTVPRRATEPRPNPCTNCTCTLFSLLNLSCLC
jgi:hypothetical protein